MSPERMVVAPVPPQRKELRPAGKDLRRAGLLVVAIGLSLLSLAAGDAFAGDAFAGAELGGGGDDFLEAKDGGRDYVDCGNRPGRGQRGRGRPRLAHPRDGLSGLILIGPL